MRVLILNQTFYPDVAATAQHMWDLARYLDAKGHEVIALTSRNRYGTANKLGKRDEQIGGIRIRRVGGTAMGKGSLASRISDFASFYVAAGYEMTRLPTPDVLVTLTSPPMISAMGVLGKRWLRNASGVRPRLVYYVMDVYPDAAMASGLFRRGGIPERFFSGITRRTLEASDTIIALGQDMKELLESRYGRHACGEKIRIVQPWADGRELTPLCKSQNPLAQKLGLANTFNIVYSGNFGVAHDVPTIVKAMDVTSTDRTLCWVFIGGGKRIEELKKQVDKAGWGNVRFLPYCDRDSLNHALNLGDVHIVSQLPEFTGIVVPSKLFGIMAVGKPILMIGPDSAECSRIVREHNAGVIIPNGHGEMLAKTIWQLRDNATMREVYGRSARHAFDKYFDVNVACAKLESAFLGVN